jgi:hypothetical protein
MWQGRLGVPALCVPLSDSVAVVGALGVIIAAAIAGLATVAAAVTNGLATVVAAWLQSRGGPS